MVSEAPASAPTGNKPRLYELDLLRIVAALAVVAFHYTFSGPANGVTPLHFPELDGATRYGYLGVDLFFTISGFVVLMTAWHRGAREFVVSRVVRLYPAFWVAVTLTAIVTVLLGAGRFRVTIGQYLANLTMLNAVADIPNIDVVYWTLWSELRFYALVLILVLIGLNRRRVIGALWAWLAATAVVQSGVLPGGVRHAADLVVQSYYAHYFIAGMALYLVYRHGPSRWPVLIVLVAAGNAALRAAGFAGEVGGRYGRHLSPGVAAVLAVCAITLVALVALRVTAPLARPGFRFAGALTYPLYLVHAHIGFIALDRLAGQADRYLLLAAVTTLVCGTAHLVHVAVERPGGALLRRALGRPAGYTGETRPYQRETVGVYPSRHAGQIPPLVPPGKV